VVERVAGWWQEEAGSLRDGNWIVVTHIGVIRALGCSMLGVPIDQALRLAPARGSYTRLLLSDTGGVTECLGVPIGSGAPSSPPDRSRPPRLALAGSAGTGKTTLGHRLAQAFSVPFLEEGMRARLEAGLDLHTLDVEQLASLVESLWQEQRENEAQAIATHGGFVSDRSSVDFAAFWLHYGFAQDLDRAESFVRDTISHAEAYDGIIVLPWNALPLVADGYRSTNPWIQKRYQALLEGLLHRDVPLSRTHLLPTDCLPIEDRLQWVRTAIGRPE
jgi:nicotinamide riboside kinase